MGFLVAAGFELIIAVALGLLVFIIGLFVGHIIVFESITLGVTAAAVARNVFSVHLFLSLLIGLALGFLLYFILRTKVGFWIIGVLLSLVWGFLVGFVAWSVTDADPIWTYGLMAVGTIVFIGLHYWSHSRLD